MTSFNSYYDFACGDFKFAENMRNEAMRNDIYRATFLNLVEQSVEKFLKHVVSKETSPYSGQDADLLQSHQLSQLFKRASDFISLNVSRRDIAWLGEFYSSTDFVEGKNFCATEEDVIDAFDIAKNVKSAVDNYVIKSTTQTSGVKIGGLTALDLFKDI